MAGTVRVALATVGALAVLAPAAQASNYSYRVVKASSSSSVSYVDGSYSGSAHTSWSLRPRSKHVPNGGAMNIGPVGAIGTVSFNVRGTYSAQAHDNDTSCAIDAPTGSTQYPLAAPDHAIVSFGGARRGPLHVTFQFPRAALSNDYWACDTNDDEPELEDFVRTYPMKTFKRHRFTLATKGHRGGYSWSMSVTLERIAKKHHRTARHHR